MKKLLITGFEPFGGDTRNPSGEAVVRLMTSAEYETRRLVVPVSWERAFPMIEDVWNDFKPDALLMVGLAGGAKTIRVERVGLNLCGATADIDGAFASKTDTPEEVPVAEGAPNAYFSTYNAGAILGSLKEAGIPAQYSYSAGAYICNYLLFSALHKCETEGWDMKVGFIHLPYAEGQKEDVPTLPLEKMTEALSLTVEHLWD